MSTLSMSASDSSFDALAREVAGDGCGSALCIENILTLALPLFPRLDGVCGGVEGLLRTGGGPGFLGYCTRLVLWSQLDLLPQVVMVFEQFGNLCGVEAGVPIVGPVHAQHKVVARASRCDVQQADVLLVFLRTFSRSYSAS